MAVFLKDFSNVPVDLVLRNMVNHTVKVSILGRTEFQPVEVGKAIKVKAKTSPEYIGYFALASNGAIKIQEADKAILVEGQSVLPSAVKTQVGEDSYFNQSHIQVFRVGDTFIARGNLSELKTYASSVEAQGSHKWIAFDVDTGESTLTKVSLNGQALTNSDIQEASSLGLGAGHFVFWGKADVLVNKPAIFTLSVSGKEDETISFKFENI